MPAKRFPAALAKMNGRLRALGWRAVPAAMGAGYLVLVGVWWLAGALSGDSIGIVRLANYATPWIGLSLLSLLLLAALLRRPVLGGAALLLAVLVLAPYGGQIFRGLTGIVAGGEAAPPDAIHVMSYNVMGRNKDVDGMAAVILKQRPDLLLLQELNHPDELLARLQGLYGAESFQVVREDRLKLMIVSRFTRGKGQRDRYVQRAVVRLPGGKVSLLNADVPRGTWDDTEQLRFLGWLLERVGEVTGPIIVAADFNMTQANEGYRRMRTVLRSTQEEAGRWFGFTFATPHRRFGALMPLIRIDHIFVGGGVEVVRAGRIGEYGNSDHFPIDAILLFDGPGARDDPQ
ncbi:MAG: endonuclease/exonuclease/phosphatase family protein [Parvibaculaceae bacterium]